MLWDPIIMRYKSLLSCCDYEKRKLFSDYLEKETHTRWQTAGQTDRQTDGDLRDNVTQPVVQVSRGGENTKTLIMWMFGIQTAACRVLRQDVGSFLGIRDDETPWLTCHRPAPAHQTTVSRRQRRDVVFEPVDGRFSVEPINCLLNDYP